MLLGLRSPFLGRVLRLWLLVRVVFEFCFKLFFVRPELGFVGSDCASCIGSGSVFLALVAFSGSALRLCLFLARVVFARLFTNSFHYLRKASCIKTNF